MKKIILVFMLITSSIVLMACGNQQEKIVIASKPMTEQYIIVEMLTYLIEDNSDLEVEQKLGIGGGTSNIHPGMVSGSIDMYPEYTGTGWLFVLEEELINDPNELYQAVKTSYEEEFNIIWTDLYGFNNTFGLAMKESLAESLDITTYSELAAQSENLVLGAEYDFYEREDGYPGLEETYGFNFDTTRELDIGLKYQAISSDSVDVINIFSTDGRLEEFGLKVLEDDLNFFPSYYAATLVRQEILEEYPELENILAMLEGQISDAEMTRMNYLVDIENQDPKDVAREFLEEKGLR
ncbi:MAG: glycine betaine ABC transporter substrate-binding protein [Bacillota bacterium]